MVNFINTFITCQQEHHVFIIWHIFTMCIYSYTLPLQLYKYFCFVNASHKIAIYRF